MILDHVIHRTSCRLFKLTRSTVDTEPDVNVQFVKQKEGAKTAERLKLRIT